MRSYIPPYGGMQICLETYEQPNKDGNAICYMIYKVLKIKINQVLRENMRIPGLERNSSLGSVSEESTLGCYF